MNISSLTDDELLRVVSPDTELEAILMQRLQDVLHSHESLAEQLADLEGYECEATADEVNDLETRIEYLEGLLDEHEIEYNK
jgi:hypothetical protein